MTILNPTCAVCNSQVKRSELERDYKANDFVYRNRCHGEVREVRIERKQSFNLLDPCGKLGSSFSVFNPKRLR